LAAAGVGFDTVRVRDTCCSIDLIATKRIVGCRAATAIASASAASFLPLNLKGLKNPAGMSRSM